MSNKSFRSNGPQRFDTTPRPAQKMTVGDFKPIPERPPEQIKPQPKPLAFDPSTARLPQPAPVIQQPEPIISPPRETHTQRDDEGEVLDSTWERVDLPSNFVFYEWDDLSVKRFGVMDHAKLARGIHHKNISLVLDVLSSTCNRDVREFAFSDFQALCIWHKQNSYLNTPYNISWRSKYGVQGSCTVQKTYVTETRLAKTREEYLEYKKIGIATSNCRDMEIMDGGNLDEDILFLFDKAQFIDTGPLQKRIAELSEKGDRAASVTARIEQLDRFGVSYFNKIDEFGRDFGDFGVQEFTRVELKQEAFNPETAIAALRESEDRAKHLEADNIEKTIETGAIYKPLTEEVPLTFDLWRMFPHV